jgi:excisionase family DNA binding protein
MSKRTVKRDPRIVNRGDAADYAGVSKSTIRRWIREGKLQEIQLAADQGGISLDDIDKILAEKRKAAGVGDPVDRWPMIGKPSGA